MWCRTICSPISYAVMPDPRLSGPSPSAQAVRIAWYVPWQASPPIGFLVRADVPCLQQSVPQDQAEVLKRKTDMLKLQERRSV